MTAAMMIVLIIFIRLIMIIINAIDGEFVVLILLVNQVVFSDRSHHVVHQHFLPYIIMLFGLWVRLGLLGLGRLTANHAVEDVRNSCFERLYQACA